MKGGRVAARKSSDYGRLFFQVEVFLSLIHI